MASSLLGPASPIVYTTHAAAALVTQHATPRAEGHLARAFLDVWTFYAAPQPRRASPLRPGGGLKTRLETMQQQLSRRFWCSVLGVYTASLN
jgi:hypothetical protein